MKKLICKTSLQRNAAFIYMYDKTTTTTVEKPAAPETTTTTTTEKPGK